MIFPLFSIHRFFFGIIHFLFRILRFFQSFPDAFQKLPVFSMNCHPKTELTLYAFDMKIVPF